MSDNIKYHANGQWTLSKGTFDRSHFPLNNRAKRLTQQDKTPKEMREVPLTSREIKGAQKRIKLNNKTEAKKNKIEAKSKATDQAKISKLTSSFSNYEEQKTSGPKLPTSRPNPGIKKTKTWLKMFGPK